MNIYDNFINNLSNQVIKKEFPVLYQSDQQILLKYLIDLINFIKIQFQVDETIFAKKLMDDNYLDSRALLYLLLPYMNDVIEPKNKLRKLSDIYLLKLNNDDINLVQPQYVYSNYQYGRCKRGSKYTEIEFDIAYIEHNFLLLKESIYIMSKKLYVNWIEVRPIQYMKYMNENLEKKNKIKYYRSTYDQVTNNNLLYYDPIEYQSNSNHDYSGISVADIYNIMANKLFNDIQFIKWIIYDIDDRMYIHLLNDNLNLSNIIKNVSWDKLHENDKNNFMISWNNLQLTNNRSLRTIIKVITGFFDTKNKDNTNILSKGYIPINYRTIREGDEIFDEQISRTNTYDNIIIASTKSIPIDDLYEYLRETINEFKTTWYGDYVFDFSNEKNIAIVNNNKITFKNLYNLCKSLTIKYTNRSGKIVYYPFNWVSLTDYDKNIILNRLNFDTNADNILNWFNISYYLRIRFPNTDNNFKKIFTETIYNATKQKLTDIVFEILTGNGLLTEFIPDRKDINQVLDSDWDRWNNSKYYVNNKYFNKNYYQNGKNYLEMLYDKAMAPWYTFYGMNWVSQISFFHRYIHNRVMYVTGGTGTGKSTQVPKLLLYALKMIDNKNDGKIICSQPRIKPTEDNASQIAYQMGVPINDENYNIQYQHSKGKHVNNEFKYILKIVTDGLLYTIFDNPLLKQSFNNKFNKNNKNLYDIVIVDEAHEHNPNMDLILTKARYANTYNNSLRLIITSATMDEDEYKYRRYYRNINDNLNYPINYNLQKYNLDRINVDRRLHISKPGQTTMYTINEYVMPDANEIDIVVNIASNTTNGNILLFKPGQAEILSAIDELNKKLPSNLIALPFYSAMDKKEAEKISKLNKDEIYNLTKPKNSNMPVPKGTYDRVVIVATNIAEASLTLDNLKFVIDTGTQKVSLYDYVTKTPIIKLSYISESSRLQRKGRVGRNSDGDVYYTYDINNTTKDQVYNISSSDISESLMNLLRKNLNETKLFDRKNDINIIRNLNYNNLEKLYPNGLDNMIKNQYFVSEQYVRYYGNNDQYDYNNYKPPNPYYQTGYDINTVLDNDGKFYMIHPEEIYLLRNIGGDIVAITNDNQGLIYENKKIYSEKMMTFINILLDYRMIDKNFIRTKNSEIFIKLRLNMIEQSFNNVIAIMNSAKYGVLDDVLKIVAYLGIVKSVHGIGKKYMTSFGFSMNDIKSIKKLNENCDGDLIGILNICNNILDKFLNINNDEFIKYKKLYDNKQYDTMPPIYRKIYDGEMKFIFDKEFNNWCDINYISRSSAIALIYGYVDIIGINVKNYNNSHNDKNNLVLKSFINAYIYNIGKIVNKTKLYMTIDNPNPNIIYSIGKYGGIYDTLLQDSCLSNYLLFINSDSEKGEIKILNKLNVNMISENLGKYYFDKLFNSGKYDINTQQKKIKTFIDNWNPELNNELNNKMKLNLINDYYQTLEEIKSDFIVKR